MIEMFFSSLFFQLLHPRFSNYTHIWSANMIFCCYFISLHNSMRTDNKREKKTQTTLISSSRGRIFGINTVSKLWESIESILCSSDQKLKKINQKWNSLWVFQKKWFFPQVWKLSKYHKVIVINETKLLSEYIVFENGRKSENCVDLKLLEFWTKITDHYSISDSNENSTPFHLIECTIFDCSMWFFVFSIAGRRILRCCSCRLRSTPRRSSWNSSQRCRRQCRLIQLQLWNLKRHCCSSHRTIENHWIRISHHIPR